jgi:hypothetical protein
VKTSAQSGRNLGSTSISQPLITPHGCEISDVNKGAPILAQYNKTSESHVPSFPPLPLTGTRPQSSTQQVIQQDNASGSGNSPFPPSTRVNLQTPSYIEIPSGPDISPFFGPGDLPTPTPMVPGNLGNSGLSTPGTDLLSSSDLDMLSLDQFLTPRDQIVSPSNDLTSPTLSSNLSIEYLSSPSFSPPGSPFIDAGMYRHELTGLQSSPVPQRNEPLNGMTLSLGLAQRPLGADFSPAVRRDSGVFSLPSQMSSDMSSDEGNYDSVSILESEVSNWASDVVDGEDAAQRS